MEKLKKNKRGITLVALVVIIVILLILAGVCLNLVLENNGIIKKAKDANIKTEHANIKEHLQLEMNSYVIDKNANINPTTLVEYIQSKQIIGNEIGEGTGKYQINVEKLFGKTQKYGNGTATESKKNDVYMLEKVDTSTGNVINKKVATTTPIKIAATNSNTVTYKVLYYGTVSESIELGNLVDKESSKKFIDFSVYGVQLSCEEGTTWYEFACEEYGGKNEMFVALIRNLRQRNRWV